MPACCKVSQRPLPEQQQVGQPVARLSLGLVLEPTTELQEDCCWLAAT